jgi:DNA-binding transcriptional MerR regulator
MSTYSLADLCQLAGVTPRTVRYYVANGLVRPPSGAGPSARYDDGHLYRLRLIRQLQKEHLPLAEIRSRLAALSDDDVQRAAEEPAPVTDNASDYIGRVLGTRGVAPMASPAPAVAMPRAIPGQAQPVPPALAQPSPPEPHRSQWDRIALDPDVELHIRRPLSRDVNKKVDRLIAVARQLFQEDQK